MNLDPRWSDVRATPPENVATESPVAAHAQRRQAQAPALALSLMVRVGILEFRRSLGFGSPSVSAVALEAEAVVTDVATEQAIKGKNNHAKLDQLLQDSIRALTSGAAIPTWLEARQSFIHSLKYAGADHPLKRLSNDVQLSVPQQFVLGLLGETETAYAINLLVADLQAPACQTRPCLHLILALLDSLFPATDFLVGQSGHSLFALSEQPLIAQELVSLSGSEPLPLRQLHIRPEVWCLLSGINGTRRVDAWPGTELLDEKSYPPIALELAARTSGLAALLRAEDESEHHARGAQIRSLSPRDGRAFAVHLARQLKLIPLLIPLELWREQAVLRNLCRYGHWLPVIAPALGPGEIAHLPLPAQAHPLVVLLGTDGALDNSGFIEIEMSLPSLEERLDFWRTQLMGLELQAELPDSVPDSAPEPELVHDDTLGPESAGVIAAKHATSPAEYVAQLLATGALLGFCAIQQLVQKALHLAQLEQQPVSIAHIAQARWQLDAEKLRLLAQPVARVVRAEQLVMPPFVEQGLARVISHARQRESLWRSLGKTAQASVSVGVRALFVGESGTGKTLAASYIATALAAPLYRVDLASVMNKYIGESEKNLGQLLDYAAATDVVLLFDEADALFGARSDGKETGERFANMLTNFLLTRLENHPGLVILTTNSRQRIDQAFSRRLDAVVEFPLPGFEERLALWHSHLGERGPGEQVYRELASHSDIAGGQLRNAVLAAAVAAKGGKIATAHLLQGLNVEYQKLGRTMPAKLQQMAMARGYD